jgi:hypothetical protein
LPLPLYSGQLQPLTPHLPAPALNGVARDGSLVGQKMPLRWIDPGLCWPDSEFNVSM